MARVESGVPVKGQCSNADERGPLPGPQLQKCVWRGRMGSRGVRGRGAIGLGGWLDVEMKEKIVV